MEALIITALVLFWLVVTLIAGMVMEAAAHAMKKRSSAPRHRNITERNIRILTNKGVRDSRKIA